MKKIYNSPKSRIIKLKTKASLLQASLQIKNDNATEAAMGRDDEGDWEDEY